LKQHDFGNVFGIGGNESDVSSDLRKSRDFFSKRSNTKLR